MQVIQDISEELADHYGGAWIARADMAEYAQAVVVGSYLHTMAAVTIVPPAPQARCGGQQDVKWLSRAWSQELVLGSVCRR